MSVTLLTPGNSKLKKSPKNAVGKVRNRHIPVFNYNQVAFKTCPGSTSWCESHCYADKGFYPLLRERHNEVARIAHTTDRIIEEVEALKTGAWVRVHTSGDFDTVPYIEKWIVAARLRPDVKFWAYTRSWRIPELRRALNVLRKVKNFQLFASTDPTTEAPPKNWRVAWIDGDKRAQGLVCPEQTGKMADCVSCGFCILGQTGDLILLPH
jgi:hypothetical protein